MVWVKLCDTYAYHPKTRNAGIMGSGLLAHMLGHCNRQLNDGHIDEDDLEIVWPWEVRHDVELIVELLTPVLKGALSGIRGAWPAVRRALAANPIGAPELLTALFGRLEAAGFIDRRRRRGKSVTTIHNYHDFQPSRAEALARKEAARLRKRKQRAADKSAQDELSAIATQLMQGTEIAQVDPENDHMSRCDYPVTIGVTEGNAEIADAEIAEPEIAPPPATAGPPSADSDREALCGPPLHPGQPAADEGDRQPHPAADLLLPEVSRPAHLGTEENRLSPQQVADGRAIVAAIGSHQELSKMDAGRIAAGAVKLMALFNRPRAAIETAITQLARDAICAEASRAPMSERDLGYWFGRYAQTATPRSYDDGAASEAAHLARKIADRRSSAADRQAAIEERILAAPPQQTAEVLKAWIEEHGSTAAPNI